jgi:hypothetical protein
MKKESIKKPTKQEREQAIAEAAYLRGKRHGMEDIRRMLIDTLALDDRYQTREK